MTIQRKLKVLLSILFFVTGLVAQNGSQTNYLNQKKPGTIAQVFAWGSTSTDSIEHS